MENGHHFLHLFASGSLRAQHLSVTPIAGKQHWLRICAAQTRLPRGIVRVDKWYIIMWYEMMWVYSLYKTGGCLSNCSLDLGSCTESRRLQKEHYVWCLKQIPLVSAAVSYCTCWFLWCQWLLNLIAASLLPSVVVSHHKLCCDTHAMIFIWHQSIRPILCPIRVLCSKCHA